MTEDKSEQDTILQQSIADILTITNKIIPEGESRSFDRRYKKRLRKQLQRRGYNYSTVRNHGYVIYLTAIRDKAIDIAFPVTYTESNDKKIRKVSIQVNLVERDQSITIPRHEPKEGLSFNLTDKSDIEYLQDLSTALAISDGSDDLVIPYLQDITYILQGKRVHYTWMMWSISILRSKAYTISKAKAAIIKRADELEIPYPYHTIYPVLDSSIEWKENQVCMIGLGPMEDLGSIGLMEDLDDENNPSIEKE